MESEKEEERAESVDRFARTLTLKVVVPRRLKSVPTNSLKLMLVTIKNAISVAMVYMYRIEKELKKRDCTRSILYETEPRGETIEHATI